MAMCFGDVGHAILIRETEERLAGLPARMPREAGDTRWPVLLRLLRRLRGRRAIVPAE